MPPSAIRTLIFDFGNVVGFFDHGRTIRQLLAHTHLTEPEIRAAIAASTLEDDYESGRITSPEFLRELTELCRLGCPEDILSAAWADIFWPNPDVCDLIPRLKGRYRLQLGSNTNELHAVHFQKQFEDVLQHFDALTLSHEVGARKPKAAFFEHCVRLTGHGPEQCVFIDDLPANIEGARACGLHGIVYTGGETLQGELAALGVTV